MNKLILLALVGLGAQLVDGSLGMAYGVTSTTLLLAIGTNPAAASATVHLAEIGTTLVSGVSHWRFGNVDWKVVLKIGVPGAVGAFAGATFLSNLSTETAAPLMSIILLTLGALHPGPVHHLRAAQGQPRQAAAQAVPRPRSAWSPASSTRPVAAAGARWARPAILASGRIEPRKMIGSIDTSEFLVAIAASIGFFFGIGSENINFAWVAALLIGGVVAAPIAAWLVRHIPPRVLGSAVGGIIILTNTRTLLRSDWIDASDGVRYAFYAVIYLVWAAALAYSIAQYRKNQDEDRQIIEAAEAREREEREPEPAA